MTFRAILGDIVAISLGCFFLSLEPGAQTTRRSEVGAIGDLALALSRRWSKPFWGPVLGSVEFTAHFGLPI